MNLNLLNCETYEDYLDSYVLLKDVYFFRSIYPCRMMVDFGYRTWSRVYTPEEFAAHKQKAQNSIWPSTVRAKVLFSSRLKSKDPVLLALAEREDLNNNKIISTIIFLKTMSSKGFYISGYIDMQSSLYNANTYGRDLHNWRGVFEGTAKLKPLPTDLSYFDWKTKTVSYNNSDNYKVLQGGCKNLGFMHRGDRKIIRVNSPLGKPCNYERTMVHSHTYGWFVFYDHRIRKRN